MKPSNPYVETSSPTDLTLYKKPPVQAHFVQNHTAILGLRDILPEDILWRRENPSLPAMICLQSDHSCSCPFQCMPKLAQRAFRLFQAYPTLDQILVAFKREEKWLERDVEKHLSQAHDLRRLKNPPQIKNRIPRMFCLHINKSFSLRMFRVNHDALSLFLRNSTLVHIPSHVLA